MKKYHWNAKKYFTNIGKLLLVALVIALLIGFMYECSCYEMVCSIYAIDNNTITVKDCNGYTYSCYVENSPYKQGEQVIAKFHNPISDRWAYETIELVDVKPL